MVTSDATVLLAEDDPNDALFVRTALERTCPAIRISAVCNGLQALKYLKGQQPYANRLVFPLPNLVLLSLSMPMMTGFQVLRWTREQPHLKGLPVVVLANSNYDDDSRLAYQLGADSYLVKPCGLDELTQAMVQVARRWLVRSRWLEADKGDQRKAA